MCREWRERSHDLNFQMSKLLSSGRERRYPMSPLLESTPALDERQQPGSRVGHCVQLPEEVREDGEGRGVLSLLVQSVGR